MRQEAIASLTEGEARFLIRSGSLESAGSRITQARRETGAQGGDGLLPEALSGKEATGAESTIGNNGTSLKSAKPAGYSGGSEGAFASRQLKLQTRASLGKRLLDAAHSVNLGS